MSAFKVGDVAIVQNATNYAARYNGKKCTVICGLQARKVSIGIVCQVYTVRMQDGSVLKAADFHLRLAEPPAPANTTVSWFDCAWRPKRLTA